MLAGFCYNLCNVIPVFVHVSLRFFFQAQNETGDTRAKELENSKPNKYQETREKIARFLDVTLLISNASTLANVYKNKRFYRNHGDVYALIAIFSISIILQSIAAITFMIVKYYSDQMEKIEKAQKAILSFKVESSNILEVVHSKIFEIDGIGRWHCTCHEDYDKIFHQMEELCYKNYRRRRYCKHLGHVCVFFVLILNILGGAFFNVLETVSLQTNNTTVNLK